MVASRRSKQSMAPNDKFIAIKVTRAYHTRLKTEASRRGLKLREYVMAALDLMAANKQAGAVKPT